MATLVRTHFDRELNDLNEAILLLGSRARQAVAEGMRAFLENDVDLAREVIAGDQATNELRYRIEQQCYALLAREQPVAGDMRAIVAGLTYAAGLERIADHGKKIGRICLRTSSEPRPIPLGGIGRMGEKALAMLADALAALAARDVEAARVVSAKDDEARSFHSRAAWYRQGFSDERYCGVSVACEMTECRDHARIAEQPQQADD